MTHHCHLICRTLMAMGLVTFPVAAQDAAAPPADSEARKPRAVGGSEVQANGTIHAQDRPQPQFSTPWQHRELRRFEAAEAHQGVAVDATHFYAISNFEIGKYRKDTGERAGGWIGEKGGAIKHLNSGVVIDGQLFCAHSNFPAMPEQSSIEIWDVATMQHTGRHVFADPPGSLTWAVPHDGFWFACFAHYRKTSDPARTRVVKFDQQWQAIRGWAFPAELVARFDGNSSSGGAFGPGGHLFVTGHDARELYVLDVPDEKEADAEQLPWRTTIPITAAGQAFAWDPQTPGMLYAIERKSHEVIVSQVKRSSAPESALEKERERVRRLLKKKTP